MGPDLVPGFISAEISLLSSYLVKVQIIFIIPVQSVNPVSGKQTPVCVSRLSARPSFCFCEVLKRLMDLV